MKKPTLRDVAELAGVSVGTVSRVLNSPDRVSERSKQKVDKAIEELSYVPDALGQGLRAGSIRTIGLVLPDVANPFYTTLARGVEDIARNNKFSIVLCNTDENADREAEYLQVLVSKRVDGLIIAPVGSPESSRYLVSLQKKGMKFVFVVRRLREIKCDVVCSDLRQAAYVLTRHLTALGHRRIGLITGPNKYSTTDERIKGYREALAEADVPFDPGLRVESPFKVEGGHQGTLDLLAAANPPTAIIAGSNFIAVGVIKAARELGITIPQKLALVSFDDIPLASEMYPFLTVAAQPVYSIGTIAANLLLEQIRDQVRESVRDVVLQPELIVRYSCGANKPHSSFPF